MPFSVYMHISPTNKRYIGITSIEPPKRWNYGYGYRKNPYFYNSILKYGWDNFRHIILCESLSKEEAEQMEIEWIAIYRSNEFQFGYNRDKGGSGSNRINPDARQIISDKAKLRTGCKNSFFGKTHTNETKRKISMQNSGKKRTLKQKEQQAAARFIAVSQKSIDGKTLAVYDSVLAAAASVNAFPQNITRACKKGRPTCRGFVWDYVDGARCDRSNK